MSSMCWTQSLKQIKAEPSPTPPGNSSAIHRHWYHRDWLYCNNIFGSVTCIFCTIFQIHVTWNCLELLNAHAYVSTLLTLRVGSTAVVGCITLNRSYRNTDVTHQWWLSTGGLCVILSQSVVVYRHNDRMHGTTKCIQILQTNFKL